MNSSHSALRTPAVRYTVGWMVSTSIWIDPHPMACCFVFLLLPVSCTICRWASWVIMSVPTIAVSWWTNWCLRCCCVSQGGAFFEAPVVRLDSPSITPGELFLAPWLAVVEWWGRWSLKEVGSPEDCIVCYKSKWNQWRPTCIFNWSWIRLCIAALRIARGNSNGRAICSKSVRCCSFVCRDISWWMTAAIPCLIDITRKSFDGKDVWRCLSQHIAGILRESHTNHQVLTFS